MALGLAPAPSYYHTMQRGDVTVSARLCAKHEASEASTETGAGNCLGHPVQRGVSFSSVSDEKRRKPTKTIL
jgi:hypothetical protein